MRYVSVTGWRVVELDRRPAGQGPRPRDLERLARDPLGLARVEDRARAEAPRAVDEDADAEAGARVRGGRLERAVLDGQLLVLALDDADVGVARATALCGVEGAFDQVVHGIDPAPLVVVAATGYSTGGRPAA